MNQMRYLKNLILTFPFFERIPDQSVIAGDNGVRYERLIATRETTIFWFTTTWEDQWISILLAKYRDKKKESVVV